MPPPPGTTAPIRTPGGTQPAGPGPKVTLAGERSADGHSVDGDDTLSIPDAVADSTFVDAASGPGTDHDAESGEAPDTAAEEVAEAEPTLPAAPGPWPEAMTTKLEEVRRHTGERIAMEYARLAVRAAAIGGELDAALALARSIRSRVEHLAALRVEVTDEDVVLTEKRHAEQIRPDRSTDLVARRRRAEHDRRRRSADSAYFQANDELSAAVAAVVRLNATYRQEWRIAAARARRLYEHGWRRVAVYWQQLVLSHKEGANLNNRLRPAGPELPAWVRDLADLQPAVPADTPADDGPKHRATDPEATEATSANGHLIDVTTLAMANWEESQ